MTATATPSPATSTQVSAPNAKKTFQSLVSSDQFQAQLSAALPKHLTPDRFTRVLLTATMKAPLLLQCTQESMFKGILDAAAAGVEIDGRRAHLIPYRKGQTYEAQLIIDYKGIAELVMRSGVVSTIHADVVCENDQFEENRGQVVKHVIDRRTDRGKMYAAYCVIVMKDGGEKCEVMSKSDIDKIRARSRAGQAGPWVTDYDEMAKKTVFRRASKWVPLSPEIRNAVEADDDAPEKIVSTSTLADAIGTIEVPVTQVADENASPADHVAEKSAATV